MIKKKNDLKQSKTNEEELLELGKFYFLNAKYDQAIIEFKKVIELNIGNSEAYYNMGLVYESKNELDEAKHMYERALNINPKHELASKHLNKLTGLK